MNRSVLLVATLTMVLLLPACGGERGPASTGGLCSAEDVRPERLRLREWEWYHTVPERFTNLEGRVLDAEGRPAAGATATVLAFPPVPVDAPKEVATYAAGADGVFRIPAVPANTRIFVRKKGYAGLVMPAAWLLMSSDAPAQLRLRPAGIVEGRVVLPDGSPVPNQAVMLSTDAPDWYAKTVTDSEGRFRVEDAPPERMWIGAIPGALGGMPVRGQPVAGGTIEVTVRVRKVPPAWLRVIDAKTGKPIEGATAIAMIGGEVFATTDETGRCRFAGACEPMILVRAAGYAEGVATVDKDRTEPARTELRLEPGGRVYGVVTDEAGRPVPEARVSVAIDPGKQAIHIRGPVTRRDGTFAYTWIPVPPGGAEVMIMAEAKDTLLGGSEPFRLSPGEEVRGLSIRVARPITARIRIVDDRGVPWTRAEVSAGYTDRERTLPSGVKDLLGSRTSGYTDESGVAILTALRPGKRTLTIRGRGRLPFPSSVEVEKAPDQDLGEVVVPHGLAIAGRVRSSSGRFAGGVRLLLTDRAGENAVELSVGADGGFHLEGLERKEYRLRCEAPGHEYRILPVTAGDEKLDIVLRALGGISAVVERPAGGAVSGRVVVRPVGGSGKAGSRERGFASGSGEETVEFPDLGAGTYRVFAVAGDLFGMGEATVEHDKPSVVSLALRPGPVIEGRVTTPAGEPAPSVGISFQAEGGWSGGGTTDPEGRFLLQGMPAGDVLVWTQPEGYARFEKKLSLSEGQTARLPIRLRSGGKLKVIVTGPDDAPVEDARIGLVEADGNPAHYWIENGRQARTGADGALTLTGIAPGTYVLTVADPKGAVVTQKVDVREGEVSRARVSLEE